MKNEVSKLSDMAKTLVKRVDVLDAKNIQLEWRCSQLEMNLKNTASTSSILDEVEERNRRKANLIIAGIPKQSEGTAEERKLIDREKIESL